MFEYVSRIEVLSESSGKVFVEDNINLKTYLQDDGRTLKIMLSKKPLKKNLNYKCFYCKNRMIEHQYEKPNCAKLGITLEDEILKYIKTKDCFEKR